MTTQKKDVPAENEAIELVGGSLSWSGSSISLAELEKKVSSKEEET